MQKEAESPQKNVRPKENPSTEKYGKKHFGTLVFLSFFSLNKSFKPQKSQKIFNEFRIWKVGSKEQKSQTF